MWEIKLGNESMQSKNPIIKLRYYLSNVFTMLKIKQNLSLTTVHIFKDFRRSKIHLKSAQIIIVVKVFFFLLLISKLIEAGIIYPYPAKLSRLITLDNCYMQYLLKQKRHFSDLVFQSYL